MKNFVTFHINGRILWDHVIMKEYKFYYSILAYLFIFITLIKTLCTTSYILPYLVISFSFVFVLYYICPVLLEYFTPANATIVIYEHFIMALSGS